MHLRRFAKVVKKKRSGMCLISLKAHSSRMSSRRAEGKVKMRDELNHERSAIVAAQIKSAFVKFMRNKSVKSNEFGLLRCRRRKNSSANAVG